MAAAAERLADRVVVTSDNPRSERPAAIIGQILLGLRTRTPPASNPIAAAPSPTRWRGQVPTTSS